MNLLLSLFEFHDTVFIISRYMHMCICSRYQQKGDFFLNICFYSVPFDLFRDVGNYKENQYSLKH